MTAGDLRNCNFLSSACSRGESWTTTLTEVVDRTDNTIVVKNSGRPRS